MVIAWIGMMVLTWCGGNNFISSITVTQSWLFMRPRISILCRWDVEGDPAMAMLTLFGKRIVFFVLKSPTISPSIPWPRTHSQMGSLLQSHGVQSIVGRLSPKLLRWIHGWTPSPVSPNTSLTNESKETRRRVDAVEWQWQHMMVSFSRLHCTGHSRHRTLHRPWSSRVRATMLTSLLECGVFLRV